jgi:hypothetical protein
MSSICLGRSKDTGNMKPKPVMAKIAKGKENNTCRYE